MNFPHFIPAPSPFSVRLPRSKFAWFLNLLDSFLKQKRVRNPSPKWERNPSPKWVRNAYPKWGRNPYQRWGRPHRMRAGSHSGHLANPQKYLGCPCLGMGSVLILGTDSVPTLGTDSVPILATNPVPLFGSRIWRHIILGCIFDLLLAFILGFEATRQIRQSPLELEERIACFEEFNLKRKCAAA